MIDTENLIILRKCYYMVNWKWCYEEYGQFVFCECNFHGNLGHNVQWCKASETWEASHKLQDSLSSSDAPQRKKHTDQYVS
jgi:hypothetical protein